ncbi:hypothetical protein SKAU_G00198170 [Synaphobranchus kaupii]|uniref:Uncharacterized protein n=1 Tax=Synaphobranchus kaupii TaxID=118154 RepID=A0A9Q1IXY3_SYNKA|nr:hypothetical protein SKAU_G00198170 [Synaphobranchus kaupii]
MRDVIQKPHLLQTEPLNLSQHVLQSHHWAAKPVHKGLGQIDVPHCDAVTDCPPTCDAAPPESATEAFQRSPEALPLFSALFISLMAPLTTLETMFGRPLSFKINWPQRTDFTLWAPPLCLPPGKSHLLLGFSRPSDLQASQPPQAALFHRAMFSVSSAETESGHRRPALSSRSPVQLIIEIPTSPQVTAHIGLSLFNYHSEVMAGLGPRSMP